ncbi:DNA polymerase III subunit delta' [Pleionea sediminis]|uniref:DNA polymerase III subunit delta' n=1 Tax=Pleionea sediminis TaxID=2569479 RepID=UPI0011848E1A|nr:DNA polymerase III subunit delta' [Pleionea sediminis]
MINAIDSREQLFPWHQAALDKLNLAKRQQRLPHGLLLTAPKGWGVEHFVQYWSQSVLCSAGDEQPCGQCKSCHLFSSSSHPDFYWIEKAEDKKQISIEQIRTLINDLHETPNLSGWRVAVVFEAEKLTMNGYNALLKTLEEPGKNTQLILVARQRSTIPATIISRCQHLTIAAQNQTQIAEWLAEQCSSYSDSERELALLMTHGAPLMAKTWLEQSHQTLFESVADQLLSLFEGKLSPLSIAEQKDVEPEILLTWWELLTVYMLKSGKISNSSANSLLLRADKLAKNADERLLFNFRDNILFQLKELREGVALNLSMQLDSLANQWRRCRVH